MLKSAGKRMGLLWISAAILLLIPGCEREQTPDTSPPAAAATVHANAAYRTYFGAPPSVQQGEAFALIGFAPDPENPGKITPFPLFMYDREGQMEAVGEQIMRVGFDWDAHLSGKSPFPQGTALVGLHRDQADLVRVELSEEAWTLTTPHDKDLIVAIYGHTLVQFPDVQRVIVTAGGHLLPGQTERGFFPDPDVVVGPGAPRLLAVVGIWEPDEADPKEIAVYFDRPLQLETFRLLDEKGKDVPGEYFRSMFDMAVIVHPRRPDEFRPGMPIRVAWEGDDRLGRSWGGDIVLKLQRLEHQ